MKLTPLYQKHLDFGATMYTTGMGYEMPAYYSSVEEEAKNVRERVGMNDVSLMGRLDVKGTDALALTPISDRQQRCRVVRRADPLFGHVRRGGADRR